MGLIDFRGEKITRRELAKRYVALHPSEGRKSLVERIKKETGIAVYPTEVTKAARLAGLPPLGRNSKPLANGITVKEIVVTTSQSVETEASRIVSVVQALRGVLNILGSKDAVKRVLDAL